jgi:transcription initiation factor TFIIIB Brf1 subunit/transcription initiation factor TFIIB
MIMEREKENNMTTAVTTCSACNKDNTAITDPECGEIICSNCGVVISEKIEDISNQERRAFSFEEADKTKERERGLLLR